MDGVQFLLGSKWKYGRRINVVETASIKPKYGYRAFNKEIYET